MKYIPYQRLFQRPVLIKVPGFGAFDAYANRDSLKYREHYGINGIPTLKRGTLRKASSLKLKVSGFGTFGAMPMSCSRLSNQLAAAETKSSAC